VSEARSSFVGVRENMPQGSVISERDSLLH